MSQICTRRKFLIGATGLTLVSCSPWENEGFNYILRIVAEVAGQRVEGSSVIHLGFYNNGLMKGFDAIGAYSVHADAEAPILDTPKGKMFALLWGEGGSRFRPLDGYATLREKIEGYTGPQLDEVARFRGPVTLAADSWPELVTFSNLADPAAAQLLWSPGTDPNAQTDVRMISATVEVTDGKVTRKIDKVMPWLPGFDPDNRLTGDKYGEMKDPRFSRRLTKRDFEMRDAEAGQI